MAEIRKLSSELIGKIAAGEVVERPASVVKELVENAIDAGATHITVELRGGGIEYLRISDNGKGIPAGQIRLAFERHATSKLQTEAELYCIHTLGFRGEALASVAAVAKVTCTTKTADAEFGVRCQVEGGEFTDIRQAASPVGTTFVVEDLFYNTPVRRKFLKKPAVEAGLVSDYMLRLILSHPEIAFRFVSQGKTIYHSMGDGKLDSALFCLYGKDAFRQMIPVSGHQSGVAVSGFIGVGELSRGNRQQQSFFINGRFFRSGVLSRALENGCEGRVMIGKFPMCALFLEMPYQNVDVNVHPNKLEVRFQDESAVAEAVRQIVYDALHQEQLGQRLRAPASEKPAPVSESSFTVTELPGAPDAVKPVPAAPAVAAQPAAPAADRLQTDAALEQKDEATAENTAHLRPVTVPVQTGGGGAFHASYGAAPRTVFQPAAPSVWDQPRNAAPKPAAGWGNAEERPAVPEIRETAVPQPVKPAPAAPGSVPQPPEQTRLAEVETKEEADAVPRLVGIVFDTYWIFETGDRLLWLDQHAAHERILYDRFMKRYDGEQISQRLLSPQLVQLSGRDMALFEEIQPYLEKAGFQAEAFDERSVAVHAIPTLFGENGDPKELFLEALDQWQQGRGEKTSDRMRSQVAQMACKHAIKGGDKLNQQEIQGFLKEMLQSQSMPTCPHGRPIVIETTRYALEKRFKRIQ
ncbi:MAG: DNA mismatch repair endonuclease MutL [Lachnospiraceae bacterium]